MLRLNNAILNDLMTTPSFSVEPVRDGIRRVLQNQWLVAVFILVATVAMRYGFQLCDPRPTGFFIYHGSPISDGSSYTYKAISIANGYGIPPEQQPAIRPFYSIALACLFTWTGFSLSAVAALNILIGGVTAVLIYLCGRLVFDSLYALAAALFFAIDPSQLIQTPQAGTEPLGLLFFVGSVYATVLAFKNWRPVLFFLSGFLIGLSNLTRPLTMFTLLFYIGLVLLVGWRNRMLKAAGLRALFMLFGFFCVMFPWLIRQERLYGIASISDNIGEAIYAATSPVYKQWTPAVRKDADAEGIPNTIGDRYRYFIDRAIGNVKANPGFYVRNVGAALWEYANTFGSRSRATYRYVNQFSSAAQSQNVLFAFLLVFTLAMWLLRKGSLLMLPNLIFFVSSLGLVVFYRILPTWTTFFPVCLGIICSWRSGPRMPVLILCGSLIAAVLGSAIFANPVLFRTILITDWLFLFFFLAAIWSPAEIASRKFAQNEEFLFAGDEQRGCVFQKPLSSISFRFLILCLILLLGFFAVSSARLIALTISKNGKRSYVRYWPEWTLRQAQLRLTMPRKRSVLARLQSLPFSVLPEGDQQLSIYPGGQEVPSVGTYIVEIDGFHYDYYTPARESLSNPKLNPKPYARTTVRLSRFDFVIPKEVPSDFAGRPLLFVGVVVPADVVGGVEQPDRPWVRGLAIIPLDKKNRLDFARAVCAPPTLEDGFKSSAKALR